MNYTKMQTKSNEVEINIILVYVYIIYNLNKI